MAAGLSATTAAAQPSSPPSGAARPAVWSARDVERIGWWAPDFAKAQTGGYLGFLAAGLGYAALDDILNVTLLFAHTPRWLEGASTQQLALDLAVRPFDLRLARFRIVPIYLGAGGLYVFGGEFFAEVPGEYRDERYYVPTALHWTAHAGAELDYLPDPGGIAERHGVFVEWRTIDTYAVALVENVGTLRLHDALSTALGYRLAF